jgi:hypothetical protein
VKRGLAVTVHVRLASTAMTVEMCISDGYVYQNLAGSGWKKLKLPAGHDKDVPGIGASPSPTP